MSDITVTLPQDYGYVMLSAVLVAFHCWIQGARVGRYRIMGKEWIEKNLKEENELFKRKFGTDIPKGGYPDMGDGRHCEKLSYEEWLQFACNQRAHGNYVEGLPLILTVILVSGLSYPCWTVACSIIYVLGREVYSNGYRAKGPVGRVRGVWFNFAALALLGSSIVSALKFTPFGRQHISF